MKGARKNTSAVAAVTTTCRDTPLGGFEAHAVVGGVEVGTVYVGTARRRELDGLCLDSLEEVEAQVGATLTPFYVQASMLSSIHQKTGAGTAMYRAAVGGAAARGGALLAGECIGDDTSPDAAKVWGRAAFREGLIVSGMVAYGTPAELRENPKRRAGGVVVYHGTPYSFRRMRDSEGGLRWYALTSDVAAMFAVHRSYVKEPKPTVWRAELSAAARVADLRDLSNPDVRELKEVYSKTTYAALYGGSMPDATWVKRYANFAMLEGNYWVIKFLRSSGYAGAVVDDQLSNIPFRSLAIWNRRHVVGEVAEPLGPEGVASARAALASRAAPGGLSSIALVGWCGAP